MRCCRIEPALRALALLLAMGGSTATFAEEPLRLQLSTTLGESPSTSTTVESEAAGNRSVFGNLYRATDEFMLVNVQPRLSYHKPTYTMPVTYSPRFENEQTEFIFQLSLKLQLFNRPLYFGFTQRSYWQIYNGSESRPFRETNYNPELFYRWQPRHPLCPGCGLDLGAEHESNGQDTQESRSWNRAYLAVYHQWPRTLVHLKGWYRIPEDRKQGPDDPRGDDNPDIGQYLGRGELRVQRLLTEDQHLAALMLRGNPRTGRGAVEFNYSIPFGDYLYANLWYFNGHGESLIDYDRSVSRVGIGVMLVR